MRDANRMRAGLALASLVAAVAGIEALQGGPVPSASPEPRKIPPTRRYLYDHGKPPMNGKREMERRLRQAARKAAKQQASGGGDQ